MMQAGIRGASVVGLGKLGACMAAAIAYRGIPTIGVDVVVETVERVNRGEPPVIEPGLTDVMRESAGRLSATSDFRQAVHSSDVTFIVVPTPSDSNGLFSLRFVLAAAQQIGAALATKPDYHLVVLTSTVMPGATAGPLKAALRETSGREPGRDFGLCYSPEFIALGSVIRDFLNPDFVLIGEEDARAGDRLLQLYDRVLERKVAVARMSPINAELAKLAVNTYVTTKITFANMLADICECLRGADVDTVTGALALDSRIGGRYLKGGASYGGPCFPRDNLALAALASRLGVKASLAEETDRSNRRRSGLMADNIVSQLPEDKRVCVLGLAYKPGTNVSDEAPGVHLAQELAARGCRVTAYDPLASTNAARILGSQVRMCDTLSAALEGAAVIVVTTEAPEFRQLPIILKAIGRPVTVIDCWRQYRSEQSVDGVVRYVYTGVGAERSDVQESLASAAAD